MIDFTVIKRVSLRDGLRPALPMQLCWLAANGKAQPKYVGITVVWADYGTTVPVVGSSVAVGTMGVAVTYNAKQGNQPLDLIKSVFVDNSNINQTVYVRFPDTGFVAECPPNGQLLTPVHTGAASIEIIIVGPSSFTTLDGAAAQTQVFLFDVQLEGLLSEGRPQRFEQRLATPSRGSLVSSSRRNAGWYWPALGDITANHIFNSAWTAGQVLSSNFFNGNNVTPVFAGNGANGTYIITGIRLAFQLDDTAPGSSRALRWTLKANYGGSDFWGITCQTTIGSTAIQNQHRYLLYDNQNMQIRLPWHASTSGLTGFLFTNDVAVTEAGWMLQLDIVYTYTEYPLGVPQA